MVRKKETPSHLSSTRHKQVTWNLPESEGSDVSDLIGSDEESDDSYEPPLSYQKSIKSKLSTSNDYNDDGVDDICKPNCSENFQIVPKSVPSSDKENVKKKKVEKKDEINYGSFKTVLQNCELFVKVETKLSESLVHCLFGKISLNILDFDVNFVFNNNFWIYVSKYCDQSAIYFEWYEKDDEFPSKSISRKIKANHFRYFHLCGNLDINLWSGLNTQKLFHLVLDKIESGVLYINIYLLKSALVKVNFPSEFHQGNKYLSFLCSYFYSIEPFEKEGEKNHKHDIDILYRFVKNFHSDKKYDNTDPQHPYLVPTLRPYQKQAVQWMLFQEQPKTIEVQENLHPLYVEITSLDNILLYYNRFGRYFVCEKPFEIPPSPGGILADEMGLGKTVEVLSCVMCHRRPNYSSPYESLENDFKEEEENNSLTVEESFEANMVETCPMIKDEDDTSLCEEEKGIRLSRRKHRIINYSDFDSVLDSDKDSNDSNYNPNLNEEENEDLEHESMIEEQQLVKRSKRKIQNVDYSEFEENNLETEFEPKKKKRKPPKFNVEEEINNDPVLKLIENVIIDKCWDGQLTNYKKEGSFKDYKKYLRKKKKDPFYLLTFREKLELDYKNQLAGYSSLGALKSNGYNRFFETKVKQKSYFECVCGQKDDTTDSTNKVQCTKCSLWQHATCVQFKLKNNNKNKYICPHCWTLQPPVPSGATLIIAPSSISHQVSQISNVYIFENKNNCY